MLTATASISIEGTSADVWHALVTPSLIKQYLFGTETECDWKAGSPIVFRGEYQGTVYEDKGTILRIEPEQMLQYSYWSSMSGTPDVPENYDVVTYTLSAGDDGHTVLTITQDGIKTEASRQHSQQNWGFVLQGIKSVIERSV
jgi:uncharacterized protein YndB with AHSA1/START domain